MSLDLDMVVVLVPSVKLKKKSRDVSEEEFGEELDKYMDDMLRKMYILNGVGLAGIQVGDDRRVLVADAGSGPVKIVNPEILDSSTETVTFTEGCLSIPGFKTDVDRSKTIRLRYKNPYGEAAERTLSDAEAVVIQHEIDHLNGKTLLDSVSNLRKNMYLKKLKKQKKKLERKLSRYGY